MGVTIGLSAQLETLENDLRQTTSVLDSRSGRAKSGEDTKAVLRRKRHSLRTDITRVKRKKSLLVLFAYITPGFGLDG